MKKKILALFLTIHLSFLHSVTVTNLQQALTTIKENADYNSTFGSKNYYEEKLQKIHDTCAFAHPNCCKAERITPFGIFLLVGTGFTLGAVTTVARYAILKALEKTHP